MDGPGKGALKRFGPQTSSSNHGAPQPQKSSSNRDVLKGHKSSSSRHVPPLHKSSSNRDLPPPHMSINIHQVPQLHNSSSSHDLPPPHMSSSIHQVPQPHKSSSSRDVPPPRMSSNIHQVPQPQKSSSSRDVPLPRMSSSSHDVPKPHKSSYNCNIPSPHETSSSRDSRDILMENQGLDEEHQEEDQEIDSMEMDISDPQLEENIGSASYGTSITRKETRVLSETRKRCLNKGIFVFEVDERAGRIVGEDSQRFITKGGCLVREHAKFDGTTWRNQSELLKEDIINKCMENSNYDPNCRLMVRAINTQLANQHRNRLSRLHVHYKKFATKEDAIKHPPNGITDTDWVELCGKFSSEEFQKRSGINKKNRSMNEVPPAVGTISIARIVDKRRREGEQISAIEQYKIGHFSAKKNKMVNEKADEIWNELLSEEAASSCSPAEICLKKLHRIPGYIKGRAASTKHVLATKNL